MNEFSDIERLMKVDFSGGDAQFDRIMARVNDELNKPVALDDDVLDMLAAAGEANSLGMSDPKDKGTAR